MGCLKITCDQVDLGLAQSTVFVREGLRKEVYREKNGVNYYPFGLSFGSYEHYGIPDQTYKYNGGSDYEKTLDWYSTPFRKYDAALGRFHGADALAEINYSYGTSVFADNNPIMLNDPTGLDADDDNDGEGGSGYGRNSILPGSNNHWSDQFSSKYRDYFLMSFSDFGSKYGQSASAYAKELSLASDLREVGIDANYNPRSGNLTWFAYDGTAYASLSSNDYAGGITVTPMTINLGGFNDPEHVDVWGSPQGVDGNDVGNWVGGAMWGVNTGVGAVSTYTVVSGKYYKYNEVWHVFKDAKTAYIGQKRFNRLKGVRTIQANKVAGARKLAGKLTKVGGALLVADIALSGQLKPSHAINAAMLGASTTGVGAIVAGVWFIADFGTMGVNYMINGEAKGIGDMIDESIGTYEMYDGVY